jgi:ComEC/Rec2-related protein
VTSLEPIITKLQTDERQFLVLPDSEHTQSPLTVHVTHMSAKRAPLQIFISYMRRRARAILRSIKVDLAEESARETGFLFVPVWLGLGSISYFVADFEPNGWILLVAVCALFALRRALLHHRMAHLIITIAMLVVAGAGCAKLQTWRNSTPMLGDEISTFVNARVVSINPTTRSHRAVLQILETAKPALKYAPERVKATLRDGAENLSAGDIIQVRLRLSPPSGPVRPTSYDFAFQSYFDTIGASGFSIGPVTVLETKKGSYLDVALAGLEQLRQTIARRIRAVISGNEAEVAVALIAGVQSGIDEATMDSLRITGLAHILSISGLHMALVAGIFMVVIRCGFAFFPNQAARLPVKKYASIFALFASFFYLLLSGSDVAAMRSFIMLAVFLIAILLDHQALTMRNLSIAAICILIVTPHEVMGPSFQMSFAATAALISAYAYWTILNEHKATKKPSGLIQQVWGKTWRFTGALAMTSIIAGVATSLFSAWHFHRLAPMGLPTNLAAMPPVSLIVMPSAVISALAMPFGLEEWPLRAMGQGINMMLAVSNYFASNSSPGISGALNIIPFLVASNSLILACILQTRLKWIALIPIPVLLMMLWQPYQVDIFVSEDAKLIAVHLPGQKLAVNRERPNAFTLEAWQKASRATQIIAPLLNNESAQPGAFKCKNNTCTIIIANKIQVTWIGYPKITLPKPDKITDKTKKTALSNIPVKPDQFIDRDATEAILAARFNAEIKQLCGYADLLVLEGPAPLNTCRGTKTQVLSALDFALHGSAEIYINNDTMKIANFNDKENQLDTNDLAPSSQKESHYSRPPKLKTPFTVRFAINNPNRPWNFERKFLRAARNLPVFQAIPRPKMPDKINSAESNQQAAPVPAHDQARIYGFHKQD